MREIANYRSNEVRITSQRFHVQGIWDVIADPDPRHVSEQPVHIGMCSCVRGV